MVPVVSACMIVLHAKCDVTSLQHALYTISEGRKVLGHDNQQGILIVAYSTFSVLAHICTH